jgi:hypothetical protein
MFEQDRYNFFEDFTRFTQSTGDVYFPSLQRGRWEGRTAMKPNIFALNTPALWESRVNQVIKVFSPGGIGREAFCIVLVQQAINEIRTATHGSLFSCLFVCETVCKRRSWNRIAWGRSSTASRIVRLRRVGRSWDICCCRCLRTEYSSLLCWLLA